MSSRHRHKRSRSRDSHWEASPPKKTKSVENQDKLDTILASLTELKSDITSVLYLDDMLIIGSSVQETMKFTQIAMDLLTSLGFTIHKEK
jgi:hypothetical protein